jgi:hypothetical protein
MEENGTSSWAEIGWKSWLIDRIKREIEASEAHVKRIVVVLFALLISTAAFALDDRSDRNDRDRTANVVDEVMRMWKANVAEDDIIAYVHKADTRFTVTADDVIAMSDAKVPRTVIKAVLDEADYRGDRSRPVERRSTVYVSPYPYYGGYYGPAYYDPFYDPFFYGPRFSFGVGVGFGHFRGGFRGGHFRHR